MGVGECRHLEERLIAPTIRSTLLSPLVRCALRRGSCDPVSSDVLGAGNEATIEAQHSFYVYGRT